ncbi:MAG TPA: anaerobic glycerol-3-phosphate dehydrogenase subunit C [Streptosporangiaceae bacterium]|nr:anaerobic glycerol-3-phosphate dehydrogenase subunit C [Streptosporangiaceae bacterium]
MIDESLPGFIRGSLDHCVKCNICETACPVMNVTPLFPGPKYEGPQAERFRTPGASADDSIDYCSGCGICTLVCPQGVKVAEINSRARATMKQQRGIPLRDHLLARPSVEGRLATPLAPLANLALSNRGIRLLIEKTLRIHRQAPLPKFAGLTFQGWARRHQPPPTDDAVVYFHGCSTNYFQPELGVQAVAVLEHNGFRVLVPPQDCCGLPLQSNGIFDTARSYVSRLARNLAPYARQGYKIVATSTSCGLMLKREALEILGMEDDQDLRVVSEQTYDICEFLADLDEQGRLRSDFNSLPITVTYHAPCQQQSHLIGKPALDLLDLIPELKVIELDRACCGIAGTYGTKREKYDVAMQVGAGLFGDIRDAGPDLAVCDSETCRWQITHGTGRESVHPVEILHQAYGLGSRARRK